MRVFIVHEQFECQIPILGCSLGAFFLEEHSARRVGFAGPSPGLLLVGGDSREKKPG